MLFDIFGLMEHDSTKLLSDENPNIFALFDFVPGELPSSISTCIFYFQDDKKCKF